MEARIEVVRERVVASPGEVRERFRKVKPLEEIPVEKRGWTLDVLNLVRRLGQAEFSTRDAYQFERELKRLHPDNHNVQAKIRQQLQELRDRGLLLHVARNTWRASASSVP